MCLTDKGEGKSEFPKLCSMFPDRAFIPSRSQTASRSPLGLCTGGHLIMAPDLADVACVEGARRQPNMWHPCGLPLPWFVCGTGYGMLSRPRGAGFVSSGLSCLKVGCLKLSE